MDLTQLPPGIQIDYTACRVRGQPHRTQTVCVTSHIVRLQNGAFQVSDLIPVVKQLSVFQHVQEGIITITYGWKLKGKCTYRWKLHRWRFCEIFRNWAKMSFSQSAASSSLSPWVSPCELHSFTSCRLRPMVSNAKSKEHIACVSAAILHRPCCWKRFSSLLL